MRSRQRPDHNRPHRCPSAAVSLGSAAADTRPRPGLGTQRLSRRPRPAGLHMRQPGVIIDRHVHVFPADAAHPCAAIAMDPMPHPPDSPQLLHVQVQQVPGTGPLVAMHPPGRLEPPEPIQAQLPPHPHHRGERQTQLPRGPHRTPGPSAQPLDLRPLRPGQPPGTSPRPGGVVVEPSRPFPLPPTHPLVDRLPTHLELPRHHDNRHPSPDRRHQFPSPKGGQSCHLMQVHRGVRSRG